MNTFVYHLIIALSLCLVAGCPSKGFTAISKAQGEGKFLVLKNPLDIGLGAVFSTVLTSLDKYDGGYYAGIHIDFDSGSYLDPERGGNWWNYFFEPVNLGDHTVACYTIPANKTLEAVSAGYAVSRERSFELIQKYVQLKPEIQHDLETYIQLNFAGNYVIGVHHRGTDKKTEAGIVPFSKTLGRLKKIVARALKDHSNNLRIFVATDDQDFIRLAVSLYPSYVVYNDFVRSSDGNPLHYSQNLYSSNYQKGKEALLDCLLLSKCDCLILPSSSSLSLLSTKFNPNMEVFPLFSP